MVGLIGFEPMTTALSAQHSTTELQSHNIYLYKIFGGG